MRKTKAAIASLIATALFTAAAAAEWSQSGFVTSIQYNRDSYEGGDVLVWLNGTGCSRTRESNS